MTKPVSPPGLVLHPQQSVLAGRQMVSFWFFAMAAGAANAGAFLVCERFVTHVTGTVTRIGLDANNWLLMVDYGLVLVSFIFGAMCSVLPLQRQVARGQPPSHAAGLWAVAAILAAIALAGHWGLFGPVGDDVEQASDFLFLCAVAFAMGLMNATVASSTALAVRTTHMTGPATDLGVHLATAWVDPALRAQQLELARLRGGKVVAFALGAGLMVPLVQGSGHLAFLAPAALVSLATLRSFDPRSSASQHTVRSLSTSRSHT